MCNPDLNVTCRQMGCFIHKGPCHCTHNPEYAVLDKQGEPLKIISFKNGVWRDALLDPPGKELYGITLLVVKQTDAGNRYIDFDEVIPVWPSGKLCWNGCINTRDIVYYWAPLPKIPED